jgi:ectoine hydroxylase-related dioxygenase (phytanoyl-CoA dioxygenase family)
VFPGSHARLHALLAGTNDAGSDGVFQGPQKPALDGARFVRLDPGDAVICHPLTAHRAARNFSADVRMQVYFRLKHRRHEALKAEGSLLSPGARALFLEMEGLADSHASFGR